MVNYYKILETIFFIFLDNFHNLSNISTLNCQTQIIKLFKVGPIFLDDLSELKEGCWTLFFNYFIRLSLLFQEINHLHPHKPSQTKESKKIIWMCGLGTFSDQFFGHQSKIKYLIIGPIQLYQNLLLLLILII